MFILGRVHFPIFRFHCWWDTLNIPASQPNSELLTTNVTNTNICNHFTWHRVSWIARQLDLFCPVISASKWLPSWWGFFVEVWLPGSSKGGLLDDMDDGVLACLHHPLEIKQHALEDPDTIMISPLLIDGLGLSQNYTSIINTRPPIKNENLLNSRPKVNIICPYDLTVQTVMWSHPFRKMFAKYVHFGGVFCFTSAPLGGLRFFVSWCKQQGVYTCIAHPECRKNLHLSHYSPELFFWRHDSCCGISERPPISGVSVYRCCEKLEGTRCFHLNKWSTPWLYI